MKSHIIGRYIVADPKICHGKPTFRGTRIMVADVLEQIAEGLAWESIIEGWHNSISREAIAEALQLSRQDDFINSEMILNDSYEAALRKIGNKIQH